MFEILDQLEVGLSIVYLLLHFSSGGCIPRSSQLCGNSVKSIPDLRMLKGKERKECIEVSVVTVGEVSYVLCLQLSR